MGVGGTGNYFVVMNTTDGNVLALRQSGTSYGGSAYNIAPDTVMFMGEPQEGGASSAPTFATNFWNLSSGAVENFPNVISEHDIQYDPVNNTFLTLQQYVRPVGNNLYLIDRIVEVDANGNVLWTWNPYDHIPLSDASPFNETSTYDGQTVIDFTHANTLDWNYNNSIIYLNSRNLNTFYKINETTGDIIWACGEFGNFTFLGADGQPLAGASDGLPASLWYHCHDVKEVAPDVFTLFNNDYENNTNSDDCRSSLMEITLNETSMTAKVDFDWKAPTQYWCSYAGANVLLPNGDFIGDFGDPTHQLPQNQLPDGTWDFNDTGAVFVEVNPEGQVVRTFTFPAGCYAYRVETVTDPTSITFAQSAIATPTPTPVINPTSIPAGPTAVPVISPTPVPIVTPTPTTLSPTSISVVSPTPTSVITPSPWMLKSSSYLDLTSSQAIIASFLLVGVAFFFIISIALIYARKKRGLQIDDRNES